MSDEVYIVLPVLALAVFVIAAAGLTYLGRRDAGGYVQLALVVAIGLAFVFLGVGAINTMTNGRGAPGETAPWLTLIAIAAGFAYFRFRGKRPSQDAIASARASPRADRTNMAQTAGTIDANKRRTSKTAEARAAGLMFISYRRSDSSDVTGRIYDRLVQHFGRHCVFKDVDSIPLGIDFRTHLSDAVGRCQVLLAVIGKDWLADRGAGGLRRLDDSRDFVRIEIESALERSVPIIPILVQGAVMPGATDLPPSLHALAYRNAIAVRSDPDFHHDVGRLIKGIEAHASF